MTKDEILNRKKYLCQLLNNGIEESSLIKAFGFTQHQIDKWPGSLYCEMAKHDLRKNKRLPMVMEAFHAKTLIGLRSKLRKKIDPLGELMAIQGIGRKTAHDILDAFRID